jgi:hypothetical protein
VKSQADIRSGLEQLNIGDGTQQGVLNKVIGAVEVAAERHRERAQSRGGSEQAITNGRLQRITSDLLSSGLSRVSFS